MREQAKTMGFSLGTNRVCVQQCGSYCQVLSLLYRQPPRHALDLAKLPKVAGSSTAAEAMAEQVHDIHANVKEKQEAKNEKCKNIADIKRRKKLFNEGNQVMVFQKGMISYKDIQQIEATQVWSLQSLEEN